MNILEQLSNNNKENYKNYLEIMSESINKSSKGLIPLYTKGCKRILDVGCGSGVLIQSIHNLNPKAIITGIDLNQNALDICNKKFENELNIKVIKSDIQSLRLEALKIKNEEDEIEKFDCIIFSSVLHEISSYYYNEKKKYTIFPIEEAIYSAWFLLKPNGKIIIRDGIFSDSSKEITFKFIDNKSGLYYFNRFKKEYHKDNNSFLIKDVDTFGGKFCEIKEFLYTYTWSEDSWDREVQEQYGILTVDEWKSVVNKFFAIKTLSINADNYVKYLRNKITVNDELEKLLDEMTILIVAEKL